MPSGKSNPKVPQKRLQTQEETPRQQGETMCTIVFHVVAVACFLGISYNEFVNAVLENSVCDIVRSEGTKGGLTKGGSALLCFPPDQY